MNPAWVTAILEELRRQADGERLFVGPDDIPEEVLVEGSIDVMALAKAIAAVN